MWHSVSVTGVRALGSCLATPPSRFQDIFMKSHPVNTLLQAVKEWEGDLEDDPQVSKVERNASVKVGTSVFPVPETYAPICLGHHVR